MNFSLSNRFAKDEEDDNKTVDSGIDRKLDSLIFESRKIFVVGDVSHNLARSVVMQLHALAAASDAPITMIVSSPGGHVESGDMIFDAIRFIKPKVIMIGSGWVASAGALIYVAADKENRYALPNTRFLLHQPSGGAGGQESDIAIQAREILRMRDRLNHIFAKETGQPFEKVEKDTDRDFWLSASEAVEYGLVNKIIVRETEISK